MAEEGQADRKRRKRPSTDTQKTTVFTVPHQVKDAFSRTDFHENIVM